LDEVVADARGGIEVRILIDGQQLAVFRSKARM
jgi:hypothetical protein